MDTLPNLKIAATWQLQLLEKHILSNQVKIETWLRKQWLLTPPSFYSSVDLRNAGFKLAPVDTNLFPAGFNNINPEFVPLCVQAVQNTLEKTMPQCQRILLIPETHTRNFPYLQNVAAIQDILIKAGYDVILGSIIPDLTASFDIQLPSKQTLTFQPLHRKDQRVYAGDKSPCIILLNHDLSEGIPEVLNNIEQTILPPLGLGWAHRLKTQHFAHYQTIAEEFSQLIDIDPWLINPLFLRCENVDFMARSGEQCLETQAADLFEQIQKKYAQYHIEQKPFIVIKADAGTYGMGVMMIDDPKQISQLNRKQRKEMAKTKGGRTIDKVIIQEGVYTFETVGESESVAEPVIYMIGQHVVGGFYRVHTHKGPDENLNAPGMHFQPLAFAEPCNIPNYLREPDCCANRFYTYGVVARLAALAAGREMAALNEDTQKNRQDAKTP